MKATVLTIGDKALGFGDGFILYPTLLGLSEKYNVRHIGTPQCCTILRQLDNGKDVKIFNMDTQGQFYTIDHLNVYNLTYWDVAAKLCGFGEHALNATRRIAELEPYAGRPLPDFHIDPKDDAEMKSFLSKLKGPIIVTQPLMSFWNKMIPDYKQQAVVDGLLKLGGTVIQIGGNNIPVNMVNKNAINLIDNTSVSKSMALIKNADLFVGGDSFCQHAAAFLKTPSVVYWCGTSPQDFGYNTSSNIAHPEIAYCQINKAGRPTRWLYDYDYKDKQFWGSRNENGWSCPIKLCEKAIKVKEILDAAEHELTRGKNRSWEFYDYKYDMGMLSQ